MAKRLWLRRLDCQTRWGVAAATTYRFARITRRAIQMVPIIAIAQGARKPIATPIMRKLHMIAPALCAKR